MPELPEVETVRSEIESLLQNQFIKKVEVFEPRLRKLIPASFAQDLQSLTLSKVKRRAKYILICFKENELTLVIHLGMSGRVCINSFSSPHRREKHDHVILTFGNDFELRFRDPRRFGALFLTDQPDKLFQKVGPEPLEENFTGEELSKRFRHKKTSIKTALLDQSVIAGLGNIYVCEALHQAHIHPQRIANDLNALQCHKLFHAIQDVLQRAIAAGGSTLRDHKHTNGASGAFQHHFKVYDQAHKTCSQCYQGIIQRIKQNNRSTYFCNVCQII